MNIKKAMAWKWDGSVHFHATATYAAYIYPESKTIIPEQSITPSIWLYLSSKDKESIHKKMRSNSGHGDKAGYPFVESITWTTDAPYRETRMKVNRRKARGAICVIRHGNPEVSQVKPDWTIK